MDTSHTVVDTHYIVEDDNTSDIVIPAIILLVFILFLGWMLYLLITSRFKPSPRSLSSDQAIIAAGITGATNFTTCKPGQCATNLQSGAKTCPSQNISIQINPTSDVCNGRYVCDNPLTPYAVQSDGSSNISGQCEPNTECACIKAQQCPSYILSIFTSSGGNPYQSLSGQRLIFPQESTFVSINGTTTSNPPIQLSNPTTNFCTAPLSWLPLSTPGCGFKIANPNSMSYQDLLICTGMVNKCSGIQGNPCLQGTLALISDNPDTLQQSTINQAQYGCVSGSPCPCGLLPIFDTQYGNIICRSLPP